MVNITTYNIIKNNENSENQTPNIESTQVEYKMGNTTYKFYTDPINSNGPCAICLSQSNQRYKIETIHAHIREIQLCCIVCLYNSIDRMNDLVARDIKWTIISE